MMANLSKILIVGLLAATTVTASVAAATLVDTKSNFVTDANMTVIHKTDALWPVKGYITVEPCTLRACQEV